MARNPPHPKSTRQPLPPNDQRPNSGMREGDVTHAEVNAALAECGKTVIFGQQNRLRNGVLMNDEKLPRFHAGHDLVRFFYQGMNKLPEYILDALLEYDISVTLVTERDLILFKDVRNHQAMHIGFVRKTIYMPEGVVLEAIYKGWDSWSIAEAVIREAWPLMDYLLILEFIRASLKEQIDALYGSIPSQPYRLSSDPNRLRTCLKDFENLRKQNPNDRRMFTHLAGVFIRLDKTDDYSEHVDKIRLIGPEALPALEAVIDGTNTNDPVRQTILRTAHRLLQTLS